jgi:predicted transcriptional regulator
MEVHFTPDVQAKLDRLAMDTGRPAGELLHDAVVGYFDEIAELRQTLDSRYDDLKAAG